MVINGLIALIGWEGDETRFTEGESITRGWIIGLVWTILFIGMASAFWLLASSTEISSRRKAGEVLAFAIFCLSYPIFTMGLSFFDILRQFIMYRMTIIFDRGFGISRVRHQHLWCYRLYGYVMPPGHDNPRELMYINQLDKK